MSARAAKRVNRLLFERELHGQGLLRIAGVDEAGCGPLAGPVVAAAVMFPVTWFVECWPKSLKKLNDSKQLTAAQREEFFVLLTTHAVIRCSIASVDSAGVDELNILRAAHRAIREALAGLVPAPEHVLVDGRKIQSLGFPQSPLIKGDAKSYSIAAASVLAKVTRDRLMVEYDRQWPAYGFAEHKGYSTARHLAALAQHGPCPIHRRSFAPVRQPELFPTPTASPDQSPGLRRGTSPYPG